MKTYVQIILTLIITTLTLSLSAQIEIADGGKVGIGTLTPTHKLHIVGSINFTDSLYQNGTPFVLDAPSHWQGEEGVIGYDGMVGIGTTNPSSDLDVQGSINFTGELLQDGDPMQLGMWEEGDGAALYDGKVGIGTTAPTQKLDVNGNINVNGEILQNGQPFSAGSIPAGVIVMWSGAIENIPEGWSLCDGTNGTPNLLDRFIVGAGNTYAVGTTGGSADAIVVEHSHSITDPGHSHTVATSDYSGSGFAGRGGYSSRPIGTSNATTAITINNTGSSGTNANLPPYYALAYIMKL